MKFFMGAGLLGCLLAGTAVADPDPLQVALDKAKTGYKDEVEKACKGLVEKFDERIRKSADGGNLDTVLRLRAEKKAFEDTDAPPKSVLMKTAYGEYLGQVKAARQKLTETYEATVKGYTKKLDTDRAEEVRAEFLAFKSGPVRLASPLAGPVPEVEVSIATGGVMRFCWVPAGKATLGSPPNEKGRTAEEPEHEFATRGFWLGKYEVTQVEWVAVMGNNPSTFDGRKPGVVAGMDTSRFPVENLSWADCQQFLEKLNARPEAGRAFHRAGRFVIPHEDEWEFGCRGGKGTSNRSTSGQN